jgi:hypothetical protein
MVEPGRSEPAPDPNAELVPKATEKQRDEDAFSNVEREEIKLEPEGRRSSLDRIRSTATDASATTQATTTLPTHKKGNKWYHNINPLRWGAVPPLPDERQPCPEHKAGFFSLLTFQWMTPLMTVRDRTNPGHSLPLLR